MKLLVITTGSYPFGGAATNRHLSYLRGLVEQGIYVKLFIIQPDNNQSKKSNKKKGEFNGIKFEYTNWNFNLNKSIIQKLFSRIQGHKNAIQKIKYLIKTGNDDIWILMLATKSFDILPYLVFSKLYNIPIFHERTEFPFVNTHNVSQKFSLWFYLNFLIPRFDGIFVITKALMEYFAQYVISIDRLIHIPMTVEGERFMNNQERINEFGEYIGYCGSMYSDKDGVPDLIQAFSLFCESNESINLLLIGDNSDQTRFKKIQNCIESSPYKERIFCIGQIERDEMPKYLNSAKLLALARPDNIQAKGGFPTKLGEYLATGKPVVVTKVGEISEYLFDKENAFLSDPDNPKDFAKKMLEVISNYSNALLVGQKGREVVLSSFSYNIQAVRLFQFMNKQANS